MKKSPIRDGAQLDVPQASSATQVRHWPGEMPLVALRLARVVRGLSSGYERVPLVALNAIATTRPSPSPSSRDLLAMKLGVPGSVAILSGRSSLAPSSSESSHRPTGRRSGVTSCGFDCARCEAARPPRRVAVGCRGCRRHVVGRRFFCRCRCSGRQHRTLCVVEVVIGGGVGVAQDQVQRRQKAVLVVLRIRVAPNEGEADA